MSNGSAIESRVTEALARVDTAYETIECDPDFADTAAFCERYGYPMGKSGNTILVASKKEPRRFAACVVLASTRLDVNKRVRRLMGVSKLSFASGDDTLRITGMTLGGVTPLALPVDLPLYVDSRVMDLDYVILGGGSRSMKVKADPAIFIALGAEIVIDLALAPPSG